MMRAISLVQASMVGLAVLCGTPSAILAEGIPVAPAGDVDAAEPRKASPAVLSEVQRLEKELEAEERERGWRNGGQQRGATVERAPANANSARAAAAASAKVATAAAPPVGKAAAGADAADVELPTVPAAVLETTKPPSAEELAALARPTVIKMRPGTTELLAVAEGHLNRIVTPFAEPAVVTTSTDITTKVSGNVVYVSTNKPATIAVTPKGDDTVALMLGLVPRRVPPREVRLELDESARTSWSASFGGGVRNKKAERWEENQPYVETLRALMRELAQGKLPNGYQIRGVASRDVAPACAAPVGVAYRFDDGQVLEGSHLQVFIGVVSNGGAQSVEVMEPWCATRDVAAVAYWPNNVLAPGQETEVYVVRRVGGEDEGDGVRPSLLRNAGVRK